MSYELDTYEKTCETIAWIAEKDFQKHVVTRKGPGEYYCHQPGTGMGSFHLLFRPNYILLWGDMGDAVLQNHGDMEAWIRGARESREYVIEKIRALPGEKYVFYPADAVQAAQEWARDYRGDERHGPRYRALAASAVSAHQNGGLTEREWQDLHADHLGEYDLDGTARRPSSRALWVHQCLRWFAAQPVPSSESPVLPPAPGA